MPQNIENPINLKQTIMKTKNKKIKYKNDKIYYKYFPSINEWTNKLEYWWLQEPSISFVGKRKKEEKEAPYIRHTHTKNNF